MNLVYDMEDELLFEYVRQFKHTARLSCDAKNGPIVLTIKDGVINLEYGPDFFFEIHKREDLYTSCNIIGEEYYIEPIYIRGLIVQSLLREFEKLSRLYGAKSNAS